MCLVIDVLTHGMTNRFMGIGDTLIAAMVIRVHRRPVFRHLPEEFMQVGLAGGFDRPGLDLVSGSILGSYNRRLAYRSPSGIFQNFLLGIGHILPLAAYVGFIYFNRSVKQGVIDLIDFTDPVQHIPSGFLTDLQIPVELHAGYPLEVGSEQVNGNGPFPVTKVGPFHDGPLLYTEHRLAFTFPATMGHAFVLDTTLDIVRTTMRAGRTVGPHFLFKPLPGRLVIREPVKQFYEAYAFSMILSGYLCHVGIFWCSLKCDQSITFGQMVSTFFVHKFVFS